MRANGRLPNELRPVEVITNYIHDAHGSILITVGNTKVICHASITEGVPKFVRGSGKGWLTAEYGMLPSATQTRNNREATRGKQSGRTLEIQRLIGRSLRNSINLSKLGEVTVTIDCDVIQADGGTRCASITGASLALHRLMNHLLARGTIKKNPVEYLIAAVSLGIKDGEILLDLDYQEDSTADTDMNIVMNSQGKFIEIQGTAEGRVFSKEELDKLTEVALPGVEQLIRIQQQAL